MASAVRRLPMKCDGRFCSCRLQYRTGVHSRQVQMLVFSESFEKAILKVTNALEFFVLAQRRFQLASRAWLPRHFCGKPVRIERWKPALQKPKNQCALFEPPEAAPAPVHRNRSIRRQRVEMQFLVARAVSRDWRPASGGRPRPTPRLAPLRSAAIQEASRDSGARY